MVRLMKSLVSFSSTVVSTPLFPKPLICTVWAEASQRPSGDRESAADQIVGFVQAVGPAQSSRLTIITFDAHNFWSPGFPV